MGKRHFIAGLAAFFAVVFAMFTLASVVKADDGYANTVYLEDGGEGSGTTASDPAGDLVSALSGLSGSTHVILTGDYTTTADSGTNTTLGVTFPVKITSVGSAKFILNSHIVMAGALEVDDLTIQTNGDYWFKAQGNPFTAGENVTCVLGEGVTTYPTIVGTTLTNLTNKTCSITVKSGKWNRVRGGSAASPNSYNIRSTGGTVLNMNISGGTFYGYVALGSRGNMNGVKVNASISGGEFIKGIYLIYGEDEDLTYGYTANYNANIDISGGTIHGVIAPSDRTYNTLSGTYKVSVTGGNFAYLTDVLGSSQYKGSMTSEITVSNELKNRNIASRSQTFTNPIMSGADPFLFEKDGYFYLVKTASTKLQLFKAASLAELATVSPMTVFVLTDGNNLWSPEVHYFSEAEAGAGNDGWYCFIGYTEHVTEGSSMSERQRQYVLKCLDEDDNLFGQWGDPVTGEAQPRRITNPDDPDFNLNTFCAGSSKMVINGRPYMTYVTEFNRGVEGNEGNLADEFHQEIMITAMDNPWTYRGTSVSICVSEYAWERYGHQLSETSDGTWMTFPAVVEGASPVYYTDSNGEEQVYLMYTGSGYWTQWYALGYLKLVNKADPLNAASWKKITKTPILQKDYSKNDINSCGHGSYLKIGDQYWVAYHARLEHNTTSGVYAGENDPRYAMLEPIYVDASGVTIGDGDGHPANLTKTYTVSTKASTLGEKIKGFDVMEEPLSFVFVDSENGNDANDGLTASTAVKSVSAAITKLAATQEEGTLIVCGKTTMKGSSYQLADIGGKLTVTSVFEDADYRENGACLYIYDALMAGNDFEMTALDIVAGGTNTIYAAYHDFDITDCRLYANAGTEDVPVKGTLITDPVMTFVSGARSTAIHDVEGIDLEEDDLFGDNTDYGYWHGNTVADQTVNIGCLGWLRIAVGSKEVGSGIYTSNELCHTDNGSVSLVIADGIRAWAIDMISANLSSSVELSALMQGKVAYRSENGLDANAETTVFLAADDMQNKEDIVSFRNALKINYVYMQISDSLTMSFGVNKTELAEMGYTSPEMTFVKGDGTVAAVVSETATAYVFSFEGISPHFMGDSFTAILSAVYGGEEVSTEMTYSAAQYLYGLLETFAPSNDASEFAEKTRTLAVDLLNYGEASQIYADYKTGELVTADLSDTQRAWATSADPVYTTVKNSAYATITSPSVRWKSAAMNLKNNVNFVIGITTKESAGDLVLRVTRTDGTVTEISGSDFTKTENGYSIFVPGVMLWELEDQFLFTVYKGNTAVSNTLSYSAVSYAYSMQPSQVSELTDIIKALIKCGGSAAEYIAAKS